MARLPGNKLGLFGTAMGIGKGASACKAATFGKVDGAWHVAFDDVETLFW